MLPTPEETLLVMQHRRGSWKVHWVMNVSFGIQVSPVQVYKFVADF